MTLQSDLLGIRVPLPTDDVPKSKFLDIIGDISKRQKEALEAFRTQVQKICYTEYFCEDCISAIDDIGNHSADHSIYERKILRLNDLMALIGPGAK